MSRAAAANGVILAEDDALLRGIICSVLAHTEQHVFLAADGNEAVNFANQFKARLVLLDIGMPNLNGLRACEAIRALPDYDEVPIVMITGYNDKRMRLAAKQLGASDFITKPFSPDMLVARIDEFLGLSATLQPITFQADGGRDASFGPAHKGKIPGPGSVPVCGAP